MNAPFHRPVDLSVPSFPAAHAIARNVAMNEGPEAAASMMAKLLMHVEHDQGGFLGAPDDDIRVAAIRRKYRITIDQYLDALWCPAPWPVQDPVQSGRGLG